MLLGQTLRRNVKHMGSCLFRTLTPTVPPHPHSRPLATAGPAHCWLEGTGVFSPRYGRELKKKTFFLPHVSILKILGILWGIELWMKGMKTDFHPPPPPPFAPPPPQALARQL